MNSQIYEAVIGLEIHAQLLIKTKLFCCELSPRRRNEGREEKFSEI
jgi:Asp-tRNA(Asn)/Glu-tRNA(Gln) amidotransferase B subunit